MREPDGVWLGWDLPGGSVEVGERLEVAVRREIAVETGLRAGTLRPYFGSMFDARDRRGRAIRVVAVNFVGRALGSADPRLAPLEHDRFAWVGRRALGRSRSPAASFPPPAPPSARSPRSRRR